jgi:hypothetical protein
MSGPHKLLLETWQDKVLAVNVCAALISTCDLAHWAQGVSWQQWLLPA